MKKWPKLVTGDVIDVIAPGYAVTPATVEKSIQALQELGYTPRVPKDLLAGNDDTPYFHSNTDPIRFRHLQKALFAKDSKAIWCLRGGYGSNRLIPMLAKLKAPAHNKVFIGISDVTSLHVFLNQKWQWVTLHASLLDRLAKNRLPAPVRAETLAVLRGENQQTSFSLQPLNAAARKKKTLHGEIVGGNLTVLQSTLGTPWSVKGKGRFLFLEDTGERGYRIDRMLEHFRQANVLAACRGILFGQFIGGDEPDLSDAVDSEGSRRIGIRTVPPSRVTEAIERFALENPKIPVWSGIESGHGETLRPVAFGSQAQVVHKGNSIELHVETGSR